MPGASILDHFEHLQLKFRPKYIWRELVYSIFGETDQNLCEGDFASEPVKTKRGLWREGRDPLCLSPMAFIFMSRGSTRCYCSVKAFRQLTGRAGDWIGQRGTRREAWIELTNLKRLRGTHWWFTQPKKRGFFLGGQIGRNAHKCGGRKPTV